MVSPATRISRASRSGAQFQRLAAGYYQQMLLSAEICTGGKHMYEAVLQSIYRVLVDAILGMKVCTVPTQSAIE